MKNEETTNRKSIVPYIILESLGKLENVFELRLFGMVMAKAQSVQKLYNKDLTRINMQFALDVCKVQMPGRWLLQPGDNNYRNIRKAFSLAKKTISYEFEGHHLELNIIAYPEYKKVKYEGGVVEFYIHRNLWLSMLDFSKGHRLFELPVYMRLKSTYSVLLYMLVSSQKDPITLSLRYLRQLLGCDDKKAYDRSFNLVNKILEPARKELDRKAPVTFHYGLNREGRGGAYKTITIMPYKSEHYSPAEDDGRALGLERQRIRLDSKVVDYLQDKLDFDIKTCERWEGTIARLGDTERQLDWLEDIGQRARLSGKTNKTGYTIAALKNTTV